MAEDDGLIRDIAVAALSEAGFEVIEAEHADAALIVLNSNADIHLLFTDINMPGSMNGLELAHYVYGVWPSIKLLLVSGEIRPLRIPPGSRFLPKPYDLDHVVAHIQMLASVD